MHEEINPASVVRKYLSERGMKVGPLRNGGIPSYRALWEGQFFFATLPNGAGLVEIKSKAAEPLVRVLPAYRKVPVRHWKNGGIYWMDSGEFWDFNLHEPDSLQMIYDFLNPEQK